jgi:hypothetical protein
MQLVDDPVVEPDERQMGLRDGEFLVVAVIGDDWSLELRIGWQVEAL